MASVDLGRWYLVVSVELIGDGGRFVSEVFDHSALGFSNAQDAFASVAAYANARRKPGALSPRAELLTYSGLRPELYIAPPEDATVIDAGIL